MVIYFNSCKVREYTFYYFSPLKYFETCFKAQNMVYPGEWPPRALEKYMGAVVVGYGVLWMSVKSGWLIQSFIFSNCVLIFFSPLVLLITEWLKELEYRSIFVNLLTSFLILSILLHVSEALLLDACIFRVVMSSWLNWYIYHAEQFLFIPGKTPFLEVSFAWP